MKKDIRHFVWRFVLVSWSTLLIVNFVVLGVVYWTWHKGWLKLGNDQAEPGLTPPTEASQLLVEEPAKPDCGTTCLPSCQDYFDAALATLAAQRRSSPTTALTTGGVKEYYIPLGSVTTKSFGQWGDTGMQAYVDLSNYGSNAKVYFEASLSIPTANGRVFLRLIQANENFYVPDSEISAEGNKPQIVSSPALTLSSGNKLYKVQIKNGMDYDAVIGFSRLKIVL